MSKKKVNAFAKYMFEVKGSNPELSMAEVQLIAGENWQKMDADEREQYKSGSKKVNVEFRDTRVRYNCLGESIEEVKRREIGKREKEQKDILFIDNVIETALMDNKLLEKEFYFFSASYFIKKSQEDVFPAEIALAKFSLQEGITDCFHMLINPGTLPLGYAATALQHSKATHRLSVPPNIQGEKNYRKVLNEILKFLNVKELSTACVPPFYVYNDFQIDEYEAAELTLQKIADENHCNNGFRVLKADQLLYSLNKQIIAHSNKEDKVPLKSMVQARDVMRRDTFMYSEIGCDTHNNDDNSKECALSKVKRWGFNIIENCGLDIDKIPGQHFPVNNYVSEDDFDEEDGGYLESCLTESFHQLHVRTISETDMESINSKPKTSSISSQLDMSGRSIRFFNPMRSNTSITGTLSQTDLSRKATISNFNSFQSNTNIDDNTVKGYEESWTKNLLQKHAN